MGTPPTPTRRRLLAALGRTAFATAVAPLAVGCGESYPPPDPDALKKSAKYRELHPEEFAPPPKAKGRRTKR